MISIDFPWIRLSALDLSKMSGLSVGHHENVHVFPIEEVKSRRYGQIIGKMRVIWQLSPIIPRWHEIWHVYHILRRDVLFDCSLLTHQNDHICDCPMGTLVIDCNTQEAMLHLIVFHVTKSYANSDPIFSHGRSNSEWIGRKVTSVRKNARHVTHTHLSTLIEVYTTLRCHR
jgi:hypothetical protein